MYIVEDLNSNKRYFKQTINHEEIEEMDSQLQMQFKQFKDHLARFGPHELPVLKIKESNMETSIIYEYCNGLTLYDRLHRLGQRYSISETISTIRSILAYYFYYEDKGGVLHRDVKLENLFIDHNSQIKVGGQDLAIFGWSRSASIAGCVSYMAPEVFAIIRKISNGQLYQANRVTEKAEIFSLAVLALELLTSSTFNLVRTENKSKDPKYLLQVINEMEDLQLMAQKALDDTRLITFDKNFYFVLKYMLDPNPENRCNFAYLYQYFGLKLPSQGITIGLLSSKPTSAFVDKVGLLCDPNILMATELRKLFYMRVDHEFCLIQFLIYSGKEVWDLANFNFGNDKNFDQTLRSEFVVISCCLALKAMIYLDNLQKSLINKVNLFNIKNFHLYTSHQIYLEDAKHILRKVTIGEDSPVKLFFAMILQKLEGQLHSSSSTLERLKIYLRPHVSKEDKLRSLNESAKLSIKAIVAHPCLEILQILFEKFLRLIEDCFLEESKFRFRNTAQGVFDWSKFVEEKYPHLKSKFILKRIKMPRHPRMQPQGRI